MNDSDSWPTLLQRHEVTPTRLRLRPQQAMEGSVMLYLLGLAILAITLLGAIEQRAPVDLLIGSPFAAYFVALPLSDAMRWCEIERTRDGWRFSAGIGRHVRWSREVERKDIMTTGIYREWGLFYSTSSSYHYLRVELAALPFSGAPKPIEIGRHLVIPRAELEALGALLEGKTVI